MRGGLLLQAVGATLIGSAGGAVLWHGQAVGAGFGSDIHPALGIDRLSGVFLLMLGIVSGPVLVFAAGYLDTTGRGRAVAVLTGRLRRDARRAPVRARRGHVPDGLGADDARAGRDHPDLARRAGGETQRLRVRRRHASRRARVSGWRCSCWPTTARSADLRSTPRPAPALVAVAALIGFAAKAGAMPLHVWLPRAHPLAPAHISALMSGVMIKVALYGLMRVLIDWLDRPPLWLGVTVVAVGAVSALGGVVYALFQHELKRLLALHSIENVGIILLGLGAALVLRSQGSRAGRAWRSRRRCCTRSTTRSSRRCSSSAPARSTAPCTGSSSTASAACCAGCPGRAGRRSSAARRSPASRRSTGFVSEWLTLQALFHLTLTGNVTAGVTGALALGALALTAALAVYCFVKVAGLVLLGPARRPACAHAVEAPWAMRCGLVILAGWCVVLGAAPGQLASRCAAIMPGSAPLADTVRLHPPGPGASRRSRSRRRSRSSSAACDSCVVGAWRRRHRAGPAARRSSPPSSGRARASRSRFGWCSRRCCDPSARSRSSTGAASCSRSRTAVACRCWSRSASTRRSLATALRGAAADPPAAVGPARLVRGLPRRAPARAARLCAPRVPRMSGRDAIAGAIQLVGVPVRRTPPARHRPVGEGASAGTPRRVAAAALPRARTALAQVRRRPRGHGPDLPERAGGRRCDPRCWPGCSCRSRAMHPTGRSATTRSCWSGLLALGRFAITVAAWDTGNGFALQGASRDLAISVAVEAALVLALVCAALAGSTTDLRGMAPAARDPPSGRTPPRRSRCSRSCSSSSPRRAGSRSTTRTRTSSSR